MKVRFQLDPSDWHGHGSETLWAEPITQGNASVFVIHNSPFFARSINNCDVVSVSRTVDGTVFDFVQVVERGGHSTYMLLVAPTETRFRSYWDLLQSMGCSYESMHIKLSLGTRLLYSVDVPPSANIYDVYDILERGEAAGVWKFQEGYAHVPGRQTGSNA
ncbi:DUF4265 domain-containing protein [Bradyrhizobium sp. Y36]|uniref:DUF4265 domain-containing protein n=1 Tax=Bradyrhizobium sp. Y36 TaxID=2035447 RepID=UPI001303F9A4|nr:DUF4265 domain-containing protein [Bradyrhizobium sp. Y36]